MILSEPTERRTALVIVGLFLLVYLAPLGVRPLLVPDEIRYAEIPREMLATGDWMVPHLDGVRYFEKPVLGYWAVAGAVSLLGQNHFAVRFSSALAAAVSAWMLFLMMRRFFPGSGAGLPAPVIYLTFLEVFVLGVFNVPDGIFSLFLTGALVSFFYADREVRKKKRLGFLILSGFFCGAAFLTKGFLAFALPLAVIVPYLLWEKRGGALFPTLPILLLSAVLVALPWSLGIYRRAPDFWHYFFWVEHIRRFFSSDPQHPQPFWFFVPVLLAGTFPWTLLAPAVLSGLRKRGPVDPLIRYAICWFLFPFLLLSASHGKLLTYILPCFPPLAVLVSVGLRQYLLEGKSRAVSSGISFLAVVTGLMLLLLVLNHADGVLFAPLYGSGEQWKWWAGVSALLGSIVVLAFAKRTGDAGKSLLFFALAAALFLGGVHVAFPGRILKTKTPVPSLMRHAALAGSHTLLVSEESLAASVCWSFKRSDVRIIGPAGELRYGLGYSDSRFMHLSPVGFGTLVRRRGGRILLIVESDTYNRYRDKIPRPDRLERDGALVFALFDRGESVPRMTVR